MPQANRKETLSAFSRAAPSKKQILVKLLKRKAGASMPSMMAATGWQSHSLRAALSRLRREGSVIGRRLNTSGETVYHVEIDHAD